MWFLDEREGDLNTNGITLMTMKVINRHWGQVGKFGFLYGHQNVISKENDKQQYCIFLKIKIKKFRKRFLKIACRNQNHVFLCSQCTTKADPTMKGTCYTASECAAKSGVSSGNCASGKA